MATFLICHGAWGAGYSWRKVRPLLRAAGHEIFTPSYTGLGERAHLTHPLVDLEHHIRDVLAVIEYEDLRDFILVGHSYGGMVATGVADRVAERVEKLVYLDAFVPENGQSLDDLTGSPREAIDGWLTAPNLTPPDTSPEDAAWLTPRRRMQPARCFSQKLTLTGATKSLRRTYIYCSKKAPGDVFVQFMQRFRNDPDWKYVERAWSHSPSITAPDELATLFCEIAAG